MIAGAENNAYSDTEMATIENTGTPMQMNNEKINTKMNGMIYIYIYIYIYLINKNFIEKGEKQYKYTGSELD
jgi:hypothetical protein